MSDYAIDCTGISKSFTQRTIPVRRLQDWILRLGGRGQTIRTDAIHPMNLQIKRGEWLGVYGPNGSGKTTLLKMIAGLLRPNKGTIVVDGTLSTFFDLGIGFHPERAARENIYLHGLLNGLSRAEIKILTEDILRFADIGVAEDLPFKCYSTGMKMRLAFAASAHIAVGDLDFQQKCQAYIKSLRAKGKTAILVAHQLPMLKELSDRIVFLDRGKIVESRV
jgi:ABC-type polysaccharide/polyol phosphate transport system ATPase subunit